MRFGFAATMIVLVWGCGGDAAPPGTVPHDAAIDTPIPEILVPADTAPQDAAPAADPGSSPDEGVPLADTPDDEGQASDADPPDAAADAGPEIWTSVPETKDTLAEDAGPTGPFTWIRITDDPENASLQLCLPFNSPGADIDAVELWRNDELLGYATSVVADLNKDVAGKGEPCANDYQDADTALGPADAGAKTGSVSLNGGQIMLQVADGAPIMAGDVIKVYEAAGGAIGVPESYFVAVGTKSEVAGPWIDLGGKQQSTGEVVVTFP